MFRNKSDAKVHCKCTVRLLDDAEIVEHEFLPMDKGKTLIEKVCKQLNVVEVDYFGLRYSDPTRQRHWLDPAKQIWKQIKELDPILFSFRVKFYPPDPFRVTEVTRYQLYRQLKRDLLHGRLYCAPNEAALLGAYILQVDMGDYDEEEHGDNYLQYTKLLLKQTPVIEEKIMGLHQNDLRGQDATTAENNFLRIACSLETYGVDPHTVKDHKGNQLYLGINHSGILTFQGSRKLNHYAWNEVHKLNFEGKMFIIHLIYQEDPRTKKKTTVGFKCPTSAACRHVWKCATEQMLFFTLPSSAHIPSVVTGGSIFSFGAKLRYCGRVEKEVLEDTNSVLNEESSANSSTVGNVRRKAASVPATPCTPIAVDLGYSSLPRSNHSADSRLDACSRPSGVEQSSYNADLDTVNEDLEGKPRVTTLSRVSDVGSGFSDYYFRESLDHSSSESQLIGASHRSSRSPTPVSIPRTTKIPLPPPHSTPPKTSPSTKITPVRVHYHHPSLSKFQFMKVFLPSFIVAAILVISIIVIIFETETELFSTIRHAPEMVTLRVHYYERIKQYFKSYTSS